MSVGSGLTTAVGGVCVALAPTLIESVNPEMATVPGPMWHIVTSASLVMGGLVVVIGGAQAILAFMRGSDGPSRYSTASASDSETVRSRPAEPAPVLDTPALRMGRAHERHLKVADAWGAICTDPLAALDHATLLDVTEPRTAAFIEAHGAAADLTALWFGAERRRSPSDSEIVEYESAVRRAAAAWDEAKRYAERRGYGWLPEKERAHATTAARLLALAADEAAPIGERASAASKAAALLARIHTVMLPESAMESLLQIERSARPEIEA